MGVGVTHLLPAWDLPCVPGGRGRATWVQGPFRTVPGAGRGAPTPAAVGALQPPVLGSASRTTAPRPPGDLVVGCGVGSTTAGGPWSQVQRMRLGCAGLGARGLGGPPAVTALSRSEGVPGSAGQVRAGRSAETAGGVL